MKNTDTDLLHALDAAIIRRSEATRDYLVRSLSIRRNEDEQIIRQARAGTLRGERLA